MHPAQKQHIPISNAFVSIIITMLQIFYACTLLALVSANFFDFLQNQFHNTHEQRVNFEQQILDTDCSKYLCPGTMECVSGPNDCSCPFPSSQLRCVLPNGDHLCISKPAGDLGSAYDEPSSNWKVDAKDDNVRDCGWVKRAWAGKQ